MLENNPTSGEGQNSPIKDFQTTANIKDKSNEEVGLKIAKEINTQIKSTYFNDRNKRFADNRQLANGKSDVGDYRKWFDKEGKIDYTYLRFKAIMIVSTAISRMIGRWMQNREKASVSAIDPISTKQKKEDYDQAELVMEHKDLIASLQEASGVPLIKPDQFVPEDKDELDKWAKEVQRLPEEISFERGINHVLAVNGCNDVIKRKFLKDSAEVGLIGAEVCTMRDGVVNVEWLKPENIIYSDSQYDDFRDTTWRGRIKQLKIIEIREMYPNVGEETIFELSKKSTNFKSSSLGDYFDHQWYSSSSRPYDDWTVDVIIFYIKTSDSPIYRMSVTNNGSLKVDKKQSIPENKGKNTYVQKDKYNIYKGVYVRDTEIMLEWAIQKNMIRPQNPQEIGDVEFPISLYMYNMHEMRNLAVPEKVEEAAEGMMLARLKIQQIVAKMSPPGKAYDINAMQELDLGTGENFNVLELKKVSDQTGDYYFSGKDAEGNNIGFPITDMPNGEGLSQLQALIATYNHHLSVFRDEVGINEMAEGQSAKPRVTNDNYQSSLSVSFNATDYMYDAYIYLMEDVSRKVGCLLKDSVEFKAKQYREILKEEDVKGRVFETQVSLLPTEGETAFLDQLITQAIQTNPTFILYANPFHLRRMAKENLKLAEIYFQRAQKRAIEGANQKSINDIKANSESQMASNQAAAENEANLKEMEAKIKIDEINAQGQNANKTAVINMFTQLYGKGVGIPASLQPLSAAVIQNVMVPLIVANEDQQKAIIQQMQAEQMAQMQQEEGAVMPQEQVGEMEQMQ